MLSPVCSLSLFGSTTSNYPQVAFLLKKIKIKRTYQICAASDHSFHSSSPRPPQANLLIQTLVWGPGVGGTHHSRHKPLGPYALHSLPCSPQGPGAIHRSMAVIREGNYTHNLFNVSQVQQRREAHKDPDQGGLLLHRREQEVQEHISESFQPVLVFKFHHCNS